MKSQHTSPKRRWDSALRRAPCAALWLLLSPAFAKTVIPVAFVESVPVITLVIGKTSDRFVFDTGGQATVTVPTALMKRERSIAQLPGTVTMTDLTGRIFHPKRIEARRVRVRNLELGPLTGLEHYEWGAGDKRPQITRKGIIGLGAFQSRVIDMDLGRGRLVVYDRDEVPTIAPAGAVTLPLVYDRDGITIRADVAGGPTPFVLDSAATGSFIGSKSPAVLGSSSACFDRRDHLPDCARRLVSAGAFNLSGIRMHVADSEGSPFDGLLGVDFFRRHWIRVDFGNKTLTVAPLAK